MALPKLATGNASLVGIDQVESLRLTVPYLEPSLLPKGTYDGAQPIPPSDIPVAGVRAVLLARSDVPDEAIQAITRTLFDFRSELVQSYPRAAQIQLPGKFDTIGLPFHPGATAYYDQKNRVSSSVTPIRLACSSRWCSRTAAVCCNCEPGF